jgi:spore maturation protein CgeB
MRVLCVLGRHAYGRAERGEGYEHANFLPALRALGHEVRVFDSLDRAAHAGFAQLNAAFLDEVEEFRPAAILCVLMHYEIWTETLDLVRARSAAALLNWGTDDSWKYAQFARYIAPHVDLYATTSAGALERARRDGVANVVATQWAAAGAALAEPLPAAQCRHQVSFVGTAYGERRAWIAALAERGVRVECFGHGWPAGPLDTQALREVVRSSVLTLNFADSSTQWRGLRLWRGTQIKARVFEVPGAGGCLLTQSAERLGDYYRIGEEIEVFADADEAAARVRRYLGDPAARDRLARAGHERTRREHTYERRLAMLLEEALRRKQAAPATAPIADFAAVAAGHSAPGWLRAFRALLVAPATWLFGADRGPRAARRLLYEVCWRIAGRHLYSARGWPGRLFYRES